MTKKEYLIKLLTALEEKWAMAKGLRLLIEKNVLNDQIIDGLQHVFAEAIKYINDEKDRESIECSQKFLEKLKEIELKDQENNEDLDQLLADI